MSKTIRKGAKEARNQLPDLLDAAEQGRATIITKHVRPVAALVPSDEFDATGGQQSLLELRGSGKALWGKDCAGTIGQLRDEWARSP
ncbi:MAG: type II toxin-antitoxin system Phd/YefM family antitoxin [Proteobacteria bacterium]|nr:type II toxin-antitoxin system Phd/YefM family antitoxin [Pseudomonadota bacterium]